MDLEETRACDDAAAFRETDRQTVSVGEESKKEQKGNLAEMWAVIVMKYDSEYVNAGA